MTTLQASTSYGVGFAVSCSFAAPPRSSSNRRVVILANAEPSEKSVDIMRKFSEQYARKSGTYFCVDKGVTSVVIKGLAEHRDTLGAPLCPCRHYDDKVAEAQQGFWNCPCVPMRERKECHCMLFLTPDNDFAGNEQCFGVLLYALSCIEWLLLCRASHLRRSRKQLRICDAFNSLLSFYLTTLSISVFSRQLLISLFRRRESGFLGIFTGEENNQQCGNPRRCQEAKDLWKIEMLMTFYFPPTKDVKVGGNDLRLKLLRNRMDKQMKMEEQKKIEQQGKFSKTIQSPERSERILMRNIPPSRRAGELLEVELLRNSYNSHSMDKLTTKSPDDICKISGGISSSRSIDEVLRLPPPRPIDASRSGYRMHSDLLEHSHPKGSESMPVITSSMRTSLDMDKPVKAFTPSSSIMLKSTVPVYPLPLQSFIPNLDKPLTVSSLLHSLGLGKYIVLFQAEEFIMHFIPHMHGTRFSVLMCCTMLQEAGVPGKYLYLSLFHACCLKLSSFLGEIGRGGG
ncbi:hypothetical protein M9H77_15424 [Catharanthus roseus]|uniref:Uncharacterized protein n=1 Tax=Catharanthus roseus TaxID=4058 RepID=A0ACC0AY82_CATRO|nr:hypothetical protein M9H77_15424 [Catharanthus roseus]